MHIRTAIAATCVALATTPALANQPDTAGSATDHTARSLLGDTLFAELVGFIGDRTALNYFATLETPPKVTFVSVGELIAYNGLEARVGGDLHGLYDPTTRAIFLVHPWTPLSLFDQGVLLHELVHHAQHASGPYVCAEETEWQAHLVQDTWLQARGLASGFDFNRIAEIAACD